TWQTGPLLSEASQRRLQNHAERAGTGREAEVWGWKFRYVRRVSAVHRKQCLLAVERFQMRYILRARRVVHGFHRGPGGNLPFAADRGAEHAPGRERSRRFRAARNGTHGARRDRGGCGRDGPPSADLLRVVRHYADRRILSAHGSRQRPAAFATIPAISAPIAS